MTNTPPPPLVPGILPSRSPVLSPVDGLARPMSQTPAFPHAEYRQGAAPPGNASAMKPPVAPLAGVTSQFNGFKSSHRRSHRPRFTHSAIS